MAYTIEQIQKVEPTATEFTEGPVNVVISTTRGQVLVSKVLVEAKNQKPRVFNCMSCGAEINLRKNPEVNFASRFPKRWLKFNLDGTEHKHPRKKRASQEVLS